MTGDVILTCDSCRKEWQTNLTALRVFGVRRPMCTCGACLNLNTAKDATP